MKQTELSPKMKQFVDLKKKHPDSLLLFRCGDVYEAYHDDALTISEIFDIPVTKEEDIITAAFSWYALDSYLPVLIRKGHRIAICDELEPPKPTKKITIDELNKRYEETCKSTAK